MDDLQRIRDFLALAELSPTRAGASYVGWVSWSTTPLVPAPNIAWNNLRSAAAGLSNCMILGTRARIIITHPQWKTCVVDVFEAVAKAEAERTKGGSMITSRRMNELDVNKLIIADELQRGFRVSGPISVKHGKGEHDGPRYSPSWVAFEYQVEEIPKSGNGR